MGTLGKPLGTVGQTLGEPLDKHLGSSQLLGRNLSSFIHGEILCILYSHTHTTNSVLDPDQVGTRPLNIKAPLSMENNVFPIYFLLI